MFSWKRQSGAPETYTLAVGFGALRVWRDPFDGLWCYFVSYHGALLPAETGVGLPGREAAQAAALRAYAGRLREEYRAATAHPSGPRPTVTAAGPPENPFYRGAK